MESEQKLKNEKSGEAERMKEKKNSLNSKEESPSQTTIAFGLLLL